MSEKSSDRTDDTSQMREPEAEQLRSDSSSELDPVLTDTADQVPTTSHQMTSDQESSDSSLSIQSYEIEVTAIDEISESEYRRSRLPYINPGDVFCDDQNEYEVLKFLGRGGYATVWLSENKKTEEYSAIKITKLDRRYREAAEREKMVCYSNRLHQFQSMHFQYMQILQKNCQHKNIVKFLGGFGMKLDGVKHIALRFEALGPNLDQVLDPSIPKFHPNVIKTIIKQLLEALKYIHRKFIIHVNVKPSNIMIAISEKNIQDIAENSNPTVNNYYMDLTNADSKLNVKLGDFGLSVKILKGCESGHRSTCTYRAPESFLTTIIDFPIDLWSMGCVIHKIVTRKQLFTCAQLDDDEQKGKMHLVKIAKALGPIPAAPFQKHSRPEYKELFGDNDSFQEGNPDFHGNFVKAAADYLDADEANRFYNFMLQFLEYDPKKRITAARATEDDFLLPDEGETIHEEETIQRPETGPPVNSQSSSSPGPSNI
uniref:Protein kinase domain-containing protein n=2 Tax=Caenorhabditis tropicalis TaxID=1561998 RepID=A0A1I7U2Y4_9PELO